MNFISFVKSFIHFICSYYYLVLFFNLSFTSSFIILAASINNHIELLKMHQEFSKIVVKWKSGKGSVTLRAVAIIVMTEVNVHG